MENGVNTILTAQRQSGGWTQDWHTDFVGQALLLVRSSMHSCRIIYARDLLDKSVPPFTAYI